ncbi:hypothetical protein ACFLTG_01120 [Chloroflexota bacterium]
MNKSLELRIETINNFRNCNRNLVQQKTDGLIYDSFTTISEAYKRTDLNLHMHVRVGLSEFCAIFQYTERTPSEWLTMFSPMGGSKRTNSNSRDLDNPMLIRIVNLFEPKEGAIASTPFGQIYGFEQRTTTAIVWLQPLDTCLMFRAKQLNHSFPFAFELPFINENRKLKRFVPCNCFRFVSSIQEGKLIDEMIKRRTQVVGNLSNINAPIKRRWSAIYLDAVDILTRCRILLCPDNVTISVFEKGILHYPEAVNFSFCSSNLEACAIQRLHRKTIQRNEHIV